MTSRKARTPIVQRTVTAASRATPRAAAVDALMAYMSLVHEREVLSEDGDAVLALKGDVPAIRSVLERFRDRAPDRAVDSTHELSDVSHLLALQKLVGRLLDQPDSVLATAFGFQHRRQTSEALVKQRIVFFAVDHALFGMGVTRTKEEACTLVAEAAQRLPGIFREAPNGPSAEVVAKWHDRQEGADPLG